MLILHIKELVGVRESPQLLRGKELAELPSIKNAYLQIVDGRIADYGPMSDLPVSLLMGEETFDATGRLVLPAWCDSHTHLVFAGSRENEFVDKIRGLSYEEIAQRGGGILNSAAKVAAATEDELFESGMERLHEVIRLGTGAIEIKSGYGLTVEAELKMLRVIQRIKAASPIPIKSTFLVHTYPLAYRDNHEAYISLIINDLLPKIAAEKLADFIDVFCETNFFSAEEAARLLAAGQTHGLAAKLHANQLNNSGGVQVAVQQQAVSADHLETMGEEEIALLGNSSTIGTLLPTAAFFLRMPYQPARALIDAQAAIALASDYNPGSSPSGNMNFVVALSCIQLKLTPQEAINAATINGAYAMQLNQEVGSITRGKRGNVLITKPISSVDYLPYRFGNDLIDHVLINGRHVRR